MAAAAGGVGEDVYGHGQYTTSDMVAGADIGTKGGDTESDDLYDPPPPKDVIDISPEDDERTNRDLTEANSVTSSNKGSWPSDRSWALASLIGVLR